MLILFFHVLRTPFARPNSPSVFLTKLALQLLPITNAGNAFPHASLRRKQSLTRWTIERKPPSVGATAERIHSCS